MEQIERAELVSYLKQRNPRAKAQDIAIYADAFWKYKEAADNIKANGTIVAHPRTGNPIENPYLKVQAGAVALLRKYRLDTGELWE